MTPPAEARSLTKTLLAAWGITLASALSLWMVGRLGFSAAEAFVIICLIGSFYVMGQGLFAITAPRKAVPIASLLIGVAAWCSIGIFAYQVLSNDEATISVSGKAEKPAAPVTIIRLFDLNVLHGYPWFEDQEGRFRETVNELQRLKPDVLVLQEAWNTHAHGNMTERLGEELGLNYVYARANGSRAHIGFEEGAAVLSRFPILEAKRVLLKPRRPLWENRIVLITKLDLGNETLTLVGVHLSYSSPDEQAEYLMEIMRQISPDIIAGDLNAEPHSRAIKAIHNDGFIETIPKTALLGALEINLPDETVPGPFIDHVFLSGAFAKRFHAREATWILTSQFVSGWRNAVSDHDGILVDLQRR